jgi:hypothetical protein
MQFWFTPTNSGQRFPFISFFLLCVWFFSHFVPSFCSCLFLLWIFYALQWTALKYATRHANTSGTDTWFIESSQKMWSRLLPARLWNQLRSLLSCYSWAECPLSRCWWLVLARCQERFQVTDSLSWFTVSWFSSFLPDIRYHLQMYHKRFIPLFYQFIHNYILNEHNIVSFPLRPPVRFVVDKVALRRH